MSHTMTIPDVIWNWAEQKCARQEGPATYLRNILTEAALGNGNGGNPSAKRHKQEKLTRWASDKKMERDMANCLRALIATRKHWYAEGFWPGDFSKDEEEIDDFLGDILESEDDLEDLTEKQQGLLGMCRRAHNKWVKSKTKPAEPADEEEIPY